MKHTIYIASKNNHKIREIESMLDLENTAVKSSSELGDVCVVEDKDTFEENAEKKLKAWVELTDQLILADDSGLEVPALGNAPGVYSARYAAPHDDAANNARLLKEMIEFPEEKRSARFVCCIAAGFKGKCVFNARGTVEGEILHSPRGENGFGYDPLFLYPPENKTFSELTASEKNAISHRANAVRKVKDFICRELFISHD